MKKNMNFYKLFIEVAADKRLTHSEKLITAYLFTLFGNNRSFYGTNALLASKLDVQKSAISVCLQKLIRLGWITITNPKSNKRKITMLNNPCSSGKFYKLYSCIAESTILTAVEKILISYILSYTDNGHRFYAKNAMVANKLTISKEGFNTSRMKFERLSWIKVKFPKSPRRELIVINHPTENMPTRIPPTDINAEVTALMGLKVPINNEELPKNNNTLPENNDNYISDNRSNERNVIKEDTKESNNDAISFSSLTNSISFVSNKVVETLSTKDASAEATASTGYEINCEEPTSTKEEATASINHVEEPTSTEGYSSAFINENSEKETTERNSVSLINRKEGPTTLEEDLMFLDYEDEFSNHNHGFTKAEDLAFNGVNYLLELGMLDVFKRHLFIDMAEQRGWEKPLESSMRTSILGMNKEFIDEMLELIRKK